MNENVLCWLSRLNVWSLLVVLFGGLGHGTFRRWRLAGGNESLEARSGVYSVTSLLVLSLFFLDVVENVTP